MKINIICVGKLKEKYWVDAIAEYSKRITRFCDINIIEVAEGMDGTSNIIEQEGQNILKRVKGKVIVLDLRGKPLSSPELASYIQTQLVNSYSEFTFIIGGSCGLSQSVLSIADLVVAFGAFTYPHQLMRVILIEQIYRAMTINNNISYHK